MGRNNFYVVGLGASAGGHPALKEFFSNIPSNPGVAFVVVTHLLRNHVSILDEILSRFTDLPVVRLKGFDAVQQNHIYVLPENAKVVMRNGCLILEERPDDEVINKTIDYFLQSLAHDQQEKAIGIIFSGMGNDGAKGAESVSEHGGHIMVQEPSSTQFNSMPRAAILEDSPEDILPPASLARRLMEMVAKETATIKRSNVG